MTDSQAALAELADRVTAADADGALSSERAVQLRAVEPLIEALGWDVRGGEVVPATTIEGEDVDYLLAIENATGVLVTTTGPSTDLETDGIPRIERVVTAGGATRGIATDGSTVVLLVEHDGEVHRRSFPFAELSDHAEALGQYHRSVVERSIHEPAADRGAAARRLTDNREDVVEAVAEAILDVADEPVEDEVVVEAERTVDALVEAFRGEDAGAVARVRSEVDEPAAGSEVETDSRDPEGAAAGPHRTAGSSIDTSNPSPGDEADPGTPATTSDGEYVVRFFGGSSSVGAVGTETPRGTTVGAVRYLLENHGLHSSITLPWRDDDGTAVLAEEPADDAWTTLSNEAGDSISVRPVDDPESARRVIDGLVEAAGLRAMFQGDW